MMLLKGKNERRKNTNPRILWTNKKLPVCEDNTTNRRVDTDSLKVLQHMVGKTKDRTIDGMVLGAIKRDGTLEIVITGQAFENEVIASGAAACILSVISDFHLGDTRED